MCIFSTMRCQNMQTIHSSKTKRRHQFVFSSPPSHLLFAVNTSISDSDNKRRTTSKWPCCTARWSATWNESIHYLSFTLIYHYFDWNRVYSLEYDFPGEYYRSFLDYSQQRYAMPIDDWLWHRWYLHRQVTKPNSLQEDRDGWFSPTKFRRMISLPVCTHRCKGVTWLASWTRVLTLTWTVRRKRRLSISPVWTATWRKFRPRWSSWKQNKVRRKSKERRIYLISCLRFTFKNEIRCFIIFRNNRTSKCRLLLFISNGQI